MHENCKYRHVSGFKDNYVCIAQAARDAVMMVEKAGRQSSTCARFNLRISQP